MTKLTDEHWLHIKPLLPPQTRLGRKRKHDREVWGSLIYRLKTGCRYRDIPRDPEYATPSTAFYWFKRWTEQGLFKKIWQALLGLLRSMGKLDSQSVRHGQHPKKPGTSACLSGIDKATYGTSLGRRNIFASSPKTKRSRR